MKRNQSVKEFEKLGFEIEDTGGGCQWMRKQLNENVSLVITDGEAGLPDLTAQLYVMCGEHSNCLAKGELTTSVLLADILWKSGFGRGLDQPKPIMNADPTRPVQTPNKIRKHKHYRNWVCRCGQIVLDYEKPQPIRWTDGHVCYFSEEKVPTA